MAIWNHDIVTSTPKVRNSKVLCANCGGIGHIYRNCNHPISSYGVICFKLLFDKTLCKIKPMYLMVQRKDSLSYIEFLRGKYGLENKKYIFKLFSNMTNNERRKISSMTFETLWKELWQISDCSAYQKEFKEAKTKFDMIKHGYFLKNDDCGMYYFDLDYILKNSQSVMDETEWGFPKGRRNINEDDFNCAFREFTEETGITLASISVVKDIKPFEEVFSGSNHVRYKHVYYLSIFNDSDEKVRFNPKNKIQCKEIKDIQWMTYEQAQAKIRKNNIERKELFKRVNQIILKNISSINNTFNAPESNPKEFITSQQTTRTQTITVA